MKRISQEFIDKLADNEIFVFGSNLQGQHGGGAARTAYKHFGAEWGTGVGPTGQCYAIPTMHGDIEDIKPYVDQFIEYAKQNPEKMFLVTRIGCGIAGFRDEQMAPLFAEAVPLTNIYMPLKWMNILLKANKSQKSVTLKWNYERLHQPTLK